MSVLIKRLRLYFLLVVTCLLLVNLWGCDKDTEKNSGTVDKSIRTTDVQDKPIAEFQIQLLDIAFETASEIPKMPHIKDRSKAQQKVVETCLELDQPKRAVRYADKIENWRMGLCYANIAYYLAKQGYGPEQVNKGLEIAKKISGMDHGRQWRNDRIKVRIAQAYTLLGKNKKSDQYNTDIVQSEKGAVAITKATMSDDSFNEQIERLDQLVEIVGFETTIKALFGYAELYNRYYDEHERRVLTEEKIKTSWVAIPLDIRFNILVQLAEFSLDHDDHKKALEVVNQAQSFLDNYSWPLENHIQLSAQLSALRDRAGDREQAKTNLDAAFEIFNSKKDKIRPMYRAETLCPIAEAYQKLGDTQTALSIYKQAVEQGFVNHNPLPRSEDLYATCCSMALSGVEPDAKLWARICQINEAIENQW